MSDTQSSQNAAALKVELPKPWSPGEATRRFRKMAVSPDLDVHFKLHAQDQMGSRDITLADVLHAMRTGFVYEAAEPAKQPGLYRYTIQGASLNSEGRDIKVILIPSMHKASVKIITVMWADEAGVKG